MEAMSTPDVVLERAIHLQCGPASSRTRRSCMLCGEWLVPAPLCYVPWSGVLATVLLAATRYAQGMNLTPSLDARAARWIAVSERPWKQLAGFGPSGFPAYARLRFIPDPTHASQSENEAAPLPGAVPETEQLQALLSMLLHHTTTPEELFFCFWDGWGFELEGARVDVPNRSYFLFVGSVPPSGAWDIAADGRAPGQQWNPDPAFIRPADHAWFIAKDVDPHWAGIGASRETIETLIADGRLDVVPADPSLAQPFYH